MRIALTPIGWPLAAALAAATLGSAPTVAAPAQPRAATASATVQISTNRGKLVTLARPMADVFVANPGIADVQVRSPTQLYIFGKAAGETTISATSKTGAVVYAATISVGNNYDSLGQMLSLAMPEAKIVATPMNGLVLLTGTVATPDDSAEAERLVQAFVGEGTKVVTRLRTATPLQVNLQVRFAEVTRGFLKNIGSNLATRDTTNGFQFNLMSGRTSSSQIGFPNLSSLPVLDASSRFGLPAGSISLPFDPKRGDFVYPNSGAAYNFTQNDSTRSSLGLAGKLLGLDVLQAIDLGERMGQVTTLANPNLTALSGETGTFLAGGEIPIPLSQGLGAISVEYKQYGVSLAYTPTVLADGRISLRVRPEVSQLDYANAVPLGNTRVPGLTTRRTETTVELGSGQSFMIAGLLSNNHANSIDKTPGIGDLPVLGALFRSTEFQRNESELVIVITPYLVKPVSADKIVLPTDGYQAPTEMNRLFLGHLTDGQSGAKRPTPTMAPPAGAQPSLGALAPVSPTAPTPLADQRRAADRKKGVAAAPGFSN